MKNIDKTPNSKAKLEVEQNTKGLENKFKAALSEPELFLCAQPKKFTELKQLLQNVYQIAIKNDEANAASTEILPELVLEDMHEEQIWQQLELRTNAVLPQLIKASAKMIAVSEEKLEVRLKEDGAEDEELENADDKIEDDEELDEEHDEENDNDDDDEDDDDDENINEVIGNTVKASKIPKKKSKPSIVDDKFFKLDDMEEFLEEEDAKEMLKQSGKKIVGDDDGINYFDDNFGGEENDDEDEEENPEYKDFFDIEEEEDEEPEVKAKPKLKRKYNPNNPFGNANDYEAGEDGDGYGDGDGDEDEDEDDAVANEEHEEDHKNGNKSDNVDDDDDNDQKEEIIDEKVIENAPVNESKKEQMENANQMQPASDTDDDNDEKDEEKPKSSFEMRQERLQQRINDYEEEVLGSKPWQLKGEIQAIGRPQNSLLEEVLEFESTTRPAPIITEETSRRLEDIIRQRIKDQAWDDVERKFKPVNTPHEYRKQLVLDQEKSKQSLAQIYEKDYQKEVDKLDPNHGDVEEEEPKEHKEIKTLMRALFIKLDALSNYHFTPRPVVPEPRIVTNTPAVTMEEVAPVTVSDAKLLAPEEVLKRIKHAPVGESERTKTDKNRDRRRKKQKQRAIHKALEEKDTQKQKMGIALSKKEENAKLVKTITKHRNVQKITASNDQGALKSSKAFFSKLQDNTLTSTTKRATKKKADPQSVSAKKLKL